MADLLTLTEYKQLAGIPLTDTSDDTQLTKLLAAASLAIRNYTGRDFEVAGASDERAFEYDGGGFLDIDDCTAVTQVSLEFYLSAPVVLDAGLQWRAMPYEGPVYHYVNLVGVPLPFSAEMGFMRNLDVAAREGRLLGAQLPVAKVTAAWGWPAIPEDVKLALLWTLEDWGAGGAGPTTPGVTAEAIEGFSRTFATGRDAASAARALLAVPNRAKDLLATYQKIYV